MSKDNGGPAFPVTLEIGQSYGGHAACDGMTLRDYFAAKANDADIAVFINRSKIEFLNDKGVDIVGSPWEIHFAQPKITRQQARYMHADAMLEARNK